MLALPVDRQGQVDTYGVEMVVNHVGIVAVRGYDWLVEMQLSDLLQKLGVPEKLAVRADQHAAWASMQREMERNG